MPKKPTQKVPPGQIRKAIENKLIITFVYSGLARRCEPHVYGIANGREQVLCWQISGGSRGGSKTKWRRFDLADIQSFEITEDNFPGARPVPHPHSIWDEVILSV